MTPRLLVVDDERLICWSIRERLGRRGYEVVTAESGEQGLELIGGSSFDVMLLDVRLPGIDGVETLRRALSISPELVVLMMSAHGTVDLAVAAMKRGAVDFLVKPFPLDTLDAAVGRAVASATVRRRVAAGGAAEGLRGLIGESPAIREIRELVTRLGATSSTVLIEGESGSGKEVVARALHLASVRAAAPFVELNCAALPEQLLENELFGHERGAFTDARTQKSGLLEAADGGTIMLDEIGEMPAGGQAKLLRLLEDRSYRRVGGVTEISSDARVIAATNADLEKRVADGRFRADLFFRLNVVRIRTPPLRERPEDIPLLAGFFVARYSQETKLPARRLSSAALEILVAHRWPGNVRELRNVIERAFALHPGIDEIRPEHLPASLLAPPPPDPVPEPLGLMGAGLSLDAAERTMIGDAMERSQGNQSQAARLLGITRDTLRYRLKKHGMV